jgi:hypothetical protein
MRKFLVLGLILAFCANGMATVWLEAITTPTSTGPGGEPGYEASTWIEIALMTDGTDSPVTTFSMNLAGGAGTSVAAPGTVHTDLQNPLWSGGIVKNSNGILLLGVAGSVSVEDPQAVVGEALAVFLVHIDGKYSDIVTLDDFSGANPFFPPDPPPSLNSKVNSEIVDIVPLDIHVTPEPMTIALLGLGGLFLRRRR